MSVRLKVKVQPKSSRNEVSGCHGDAVKIRLTASPVKGKANQALIRFLAGKLGLSRDCIHLVSGKTARIKIIEISGLEQNEIQKKLGI